MMKFNFALCFVIFFSINVIGQKLELDKVTKEELLEQKNPNDTSATAAFLFKKARTTFKYSLKDGFVSYTKFQIKLKVYKKEGLKWADFRIPYYVGYQKLNDESIEIGSAYTYNLENNKIVKTKVTSESKFVEQVNEYWKTKSITFPNVKEGSIIELEYTLKTENLATLPEFQFQFDIPVNYAEYITEIPNIYVYSGMKTGFVNVENEAKYENVSQPYDDKYEGVSNLNFQQTKTKYTVKNVPAIKEEGYVNNIKNYLGKILHELQIVRMPDEKPKQIATSWEDVAKSIYQEEDFNTAVNKFDYYAFDIKSMINGVSSQEEKAKKIFNFVKGRMNWNGKYNYYPRSKMEEAYANKVGNVAEINLMLVSMLRMAGLDANPVLVSTRENGDAVFPNRTLFNYVIASVFINEKTILLDATSKNADLNILPIRDLNSSGRLIKNDGSSAEIDLMPRSNSRESTNIIGSINANGEVSGKIQDKYFEYNAFVFREKYNGIATESYIEKLEKKQLGLEIKDYTVQNSLDLELPIIENYNFTSTNSTEIIGNKIYVSPLLFFALTENPFKQEYREYPIDFEFPKQEKLNVSLTIPDGYSVETLPQSKEVNLTNKLGNFSCLFSTTGNQIQVDCEININKAVFNAGYYQALKEFFRQILEKQTEKIVLKRA